MDFETVKLITDIMRNELPNRKSYLNHLKELTKQHRKGANINSISKEINGINEFINNEVLTEIEKEEFLVVRNELQTIFIHKTN